MRANSRFCYYLTGCLLFFVCLAPAGQSADSPPPQTVVAGAVVDDAGNRRYISVQVRDANDQPVAGAQVEFLGDMRRLADGLSDAQGQWRGLVPADVKLWSVYARKSGAGFDYATGARGRGSITEPLPMPDQVALKLDGAHTIKVKALDRDNQPVAGVRVGLWYVQKPDYEADINLSGTSDRWAETGADGTVTLDWLPRQVVRSWSIMYRAENHFALDHAFYVPADKPVDELTINLLPLEELSGRVTHADGTPAANITVRADGRGAGQNQFRQAARTDNDGRYQFNAYSQQAYVVAVADKTWAAPYRADVVIRAGQPVTGIDFVLTRATRIHGRVTVGETDTPAPKALLSAVVNKGQIPDDLRRKDDRIYHAIQMSHSTQTDDDGRFELFLGPGNYDLQGPPRTQRIKITIPAENAPAELVHDFKMPRPEAGPLAVKVIDQQGQPVAGATVNGYYASSQARRMFNAAKTDAQGSHQTQRSLDPLVLHSQSSDKQLAGITRIDATTASAEIRLASLATATGRLLDLQGQPLAQKEVIYGIVIYQGEPLRSPFSTSFGGRPTTDAEGRFTLEGLVPGERYDISIKIDEHSQRRVSHITPAAAGPIDLGDIKADDQPVKPYVPPTPKDRTAAAFARRETSSAQKRLNDAIVEGKREYTKPLLLLGQLSDPACVDLMRQFHEAPQPSIAANPAIQQTPTPHAMRWEFELVALNINELETQALARQLGITMLPGQPPLLAVINNDSTVAAAYSLQLDDGKLNSQSLVEFLQKHKPPTRDAQQMLADGLKQANAEGKRVFFILSASWCGPCRLLAAFIDEHKAELQRHFVVVKLDVSRDENAKALQERYKESRSGGVPWFTILDEQGQITVTSNAPGQERELGNNNIGFPSQPAAVEHFANMLRQTAPNLSADYLAKIRDALLKK